MYFVRGDADFDATALRQGDILSGVPFVLLEHGKMVVLGKLDAAYDFARVPTISSKIHEHRGDREWVTIQVPARFCLCAVLSNCCDLEARGGRVQARMVTLARLRPVSNAIRSDVQKLNSLRANKDPRDQEDPGYIDYFYLEAHPLLHNQEWNVEFGQVVSIPTSDVELLLRQKVIQLDDLTRMKFKIKLAFTLGRPNEEELEAGLENPWQTPRNGPPAEDSPGAR